MNDFVRERDSCASSVRRDWVIRICICLIAALIVSILAPFGSSERFSFSGRILYWGAVITIAFLLAYLIRKVVRRQMRGSDLRRDLLAAGFISLALAPLIWRVNIRFLNSELEHWVFFLEHFALVFLIALCPTMLRQYYRNQVSELQPGGRQSSDVPISLPLDIADDFNLKSTPLMRHIAPELRGAIQRVSADGHQLLVFTEFGESRVRMRFADAVTELGLDNGLQIHRSHWVAKDVIAGFAQDGRRYFITLKCGAVLPVSSKRIADLQAAGFDAKRG